MPFLSDLQGQIRSQDFFGHQISLNFDRKGDRHNTIIGGCFSIFIRLFIAWYVILKLLTLFQHGDDSVQYNETLIDLNSTGEINYKDTGFRMFVTLKNLQHDMISKGEDVDQIPQSIFLEDDVERYIQLLFVQGSENWYQANPKDFIKKNSTRARQCKLEDFGDGKESLGYFESWTGFSLLCPDVDNHDFILQNTLGSMISKYLSFEVRRCVNTTENGNWCHSPQEIDDYLSKSSVEFWTIQTHVDM